MSMHQKLLAKMATAVKALGHTCRADLAVTDFRGIDGGRYAGHVTLQYDRDLGAPTARDVQAFFSDNFGNQVQPQTQTLRVYEDEGVAQVAANSVVVTRPIADADQDHMVRVTPVKYVDATTQEVWNVHNDESGRKYMVRESSESLDDLVEARRNRERSAPKVAATKMALLQLDKGDRVSFYDNGILAYGEIDDVDAVSVGITASTGKVRVSKSAVVKILAKGESQIADEKDELRRYFSEAFGDPSYAAELTEKMTIDGQPTSGEQHDSPIKPKK